MPKFEIRHEAGNFVSDEIADLVQRYFSPKEIEKLERLGGLITIKVTSPFKPKEQRRKEPVAINDELVEFLRNIRAHPEELERFLSTLTVRELRHLGAFLKRPLRTNASRRENVSELVRYFSSEEQWKRIAGTLSLKEET